MTYFYYDEPVYSFLDRYYEEIEVGVTGNDVILHLEHDEDGEDRGLDLDLTPLEAVALAAGLIRGAEIAVGAK